LVQSHFNIPFSALQPQNKGTYLDIATRIVDFLKTNFTLKLPAYRMQDCYYELVGIPELRQTDSEEVCYYQGSFNLGQLTKNVIWPRQALTTPDNVATSLGLALDEGNITECLVARFRGSQWLFSRLVAVVVCVVFVDRHSQAGRAALRSQKVVML